MSKEGQISRGEKWNAVTAKNTYESTLKDKEGKETNEARDAKLILKWLNENEVIQSDITTYTNSQKPVEKPTKSKDRK